MRLDAGDYGLLAWGTTALAAWHMAGGRYALAVMLTVLAFMAMRTATS